MGLNTKIQRNHYWKLPFFISVVLVTLFLITGVARQQQTSRPNITVIAIYLDDEPAQGESTVTFTRQASYTGTAGAGTTGTLEYYSQEPQYYVNDFVLQTDLNGCIETNLQNIVDISITNSSGTTTRNNWNVCSAANGDSDFYAKLTTSANAATAPDSFQLQLDYNFQNEEQGLTSIHPSSVQEFSLVGNNGEFYADDSSVTITSEGIYVSDIPAGTYDMNLVIKPTPTECVDNPFSTTSICTNSQLAEVQNITRTYTFDNDALVSDTIGVDLAGIFAASDSGGTSSSDENTPTCESSTPGIGWIMCAGVNAVVGVVNWFADIIGYFLKVSPVVANDADGDPTSVYQAWNSFKNISLGLIVVAALLAVFGQAIGMEAYTVKKMLPRIIIASIAILLSYSIVALLVDIFNVLGSGIHDLLINTLDASIEVDFASFVTLTLGALVGGAGLAVGAIWASTSSFGAAGGTIALFVILPLALAILGVFFTLIFRQILIVMLIILSPLAMLAWILPNTEKYFKLWMDTLIKALVMYPLIMLLITSGQIYASIITSGDNRGPANLIVALLAVTIPLFLVPMTFRFAGSAVAGASNLIKNASTKGVEYAKGDKQDPNSLRNSLAAKRVYKQAEYGRGGRFKNLTNSRLLRNTAIGTNSLKHATVQAQKIGRAQSLLDGVSKSANGRAVETMIFGKKIGPGKTDPKTGAIASAAEGTDAEIALGKSMREDPEVYAEGYAMSMGAKVSSQADLLQYIDALDSAPASVDKGQTYAGASKRPTTSQNKLGIGRTVRGASKDHKRIVYDWEDNAVSGKTATERRDGSTDFINSAQGLKPWELAGHSTFTFESLSNYVDYAREFGTEEEMVAVTRMASQIAEGSGTYVDPDTGEQRNSNPATIEVQKAARKFVDKAELAGFGPPLGPPAPGYGSTPATPTGPVPTRRGGRRTGGGATTGGAPTTPTPTGGTTVGGTPPAPGTVTPPRPPAPGPKLDDDEIGRM